MTSEVKQRIEQIRRGEVPEGYKRTPLGVVPANWIETTLGEIYTERNEPGNDDLPLLMVSIHSGVSDGEVDEEDLPKKFKRIEDKSQYKHAMPGDLVLNMMRAWQGAIGSVRTEGMVSPAYIVAAPNDLVDPIFMDYYMKTPRMINMLHRQSYGVTDFRLRLYWDSFSPIPCVLPPIAEQRQIAEILVTQDKLIKAEQERISALKKLKQAYMSKMFPKDGSNMPELRFGEYVDAWEQRNLGQVADIVGGGTPSTSNPEYWDGDIDWYAPAEIADQVYVRSSQRKITKNGLKNCSAKMLPVGTVLFTSRAGIGKTAILSKESCTNQGFQSIVPHRDELDSYFIFSRTEELKKYGETVGAGSTFVEVSGKQMANMPLMMPTSIDEQQAIGSFFESIDRAIILHQREVELQQKKKKAIMELLLTGILKSIEEKT